MTDLEAKYILDKHTLLFNIAESNKSIPDASHGAMQEIYNALKHFQPDYFWDSCCGSCSIRMVDDANAKRKELNLKFHTFPKQE